MSPPAALHVFPFRAFAALIVLSAVSAAAAAEPTEGEKLFALKVQPIFQAKCAGCHAEDPDALEGDFDLRSLEGLKRGGYEFGSSVLAPGDSGESKLLAIVSRELPGYEMPPKDADRLGEEEIWAIRDWIDAGAPWPDETRVAEIYALHAKGVTVATSGGLSEAWTQRKYDPEDLWAWRPLRQDFATPIPQPEGPAAIDAFIEADLRRRGIEPAPRADRLTLIRRASFDLLGLPPTPEEVDRFVDDPADDREAFASLVDRLLASPHYGEQWARHWLDVARYADSGGFANDWERPNAWRYRDYIIRSLNDDKPFDRFATEQLAGDELIAQAEAEGQPMDEREQSELRIAVGFLRMGPWEQTGMSVAKVTRQQFLDDITDAVGQVFLAQPLQCCRCHDHKFDPIPTRDYYAFQAVFATTQFAEPDACWLESENLTGMETDRRYHEMRHAANDRVLRDLEESKRRYEADWFAARGLEYSSVAEAKKAGLKGDELPPKQELTPEQYGLERIARKWRARFGWESDRYEPIAFSVYNGATIERKNVEGRLKMPEDPLAGGSLERTAILSGGDVFSPAEPVSPGVLSAVPGSLDYRVPEDVAGRRLALALWIFGGENPLPSRVIANRVWTHHFGRGIAGNPNNFGATGKKPTHPELLDWLAREMVRGGWSLKAMHRLVMNSEAYCRSSSHPDPAALHQKDPLGESYAAFQPRRLAAEEIRDAMLAASGELNPEAGGIPVRPDMNREAALQPRMIMGTFAPSYVPSPQPATRNRRTIYTHKIRGHRDPMLETFNQPGSETPCELRDQSNVTPQAFALLNGEESNDRGLAMAIRVDSETEDDREAVALAMRLVWSREPSAEEIDLAVSHWDAMQRRHAAFDFEPRPMPTEVVREAIDENTGRPFSFTETLFEYRDYIADPQPEDVSPRLRGLADVCLALLNSNEFVYVY